MKELFSTSLMYFWIKGLLELDEHFLKINLGNSILFGFVPAGKSSSSIPLNNISAVNMHTSYNIIKIILGPILFVAGISIIFDGNIIIGLLLVIAGINLFDNGFIIMLDVNLHADTEYLSVPFFEKNKLLKFKDEIEKSIAKNMDSLNVAKATDRQLEAMAKQTELLNNISSSISKNQNDSN